MLDNEIDLEEWVIALLNTYQTQTNTESHTS